MNFIEHDRSHCLQLDSFSAFSLVLGSALVLVGCGGDVHKDGTPSGIGGSNSHSGGVTSTKSGVGGGLGGSGGTGSSSGASAGASSSGGASTGGTAPNSGTSGALLSAVCVPAEVALDYPNAIFVSAKSGADETARGTPANPLKTLVRAFQEATALSAKSIYLDEGSYPPGLVLTEQSAGIAIRGGWKFEGTGWKRDCDAGYRTRTVIGGDDATGVRVAYVTSASAITFDSLTIQSKSTGNVVNDKSGESLYGLFVAGNSSKVNLVAVNIEVGRAADGGTATAPPASGNTTCSGLVCPGGTQPPAGPEGASSSQLGAFSNLGFMPADGAAGTPGQTGPNGTPGIHGAENFCYASCAGQCTTSPASCTASTTGSMAGSSSGTCGCGGLGGLGGAAGRGGGAAIGIYIFGDESYVHADQVIVTVDGAGNGSNGSSGGPGGPGTQGKPGSDSGNCPQSCTTTGTVGTASCSCVLQPAKFLGGAAGGNGIPGSIGGDGGCGAGGDALGVVVGASANLLTVDSTSIAYTLGPAGAGRCGALDGRRIDAQRIVIAN